VAVHKCDIAAVRVVHTVDARHRHLRALQCMHGTQMGHVFKRRKPQVLPCWSRRMPPRARSCKALLVNLDGRATWLLIHERIRAARRSMLVWTTPITRLWVPWSARRTRTCPREVVLQPSSLCTHSLWPYRAAKWRHVLWRRSSVSNGSEPLVTRYSTQSGCLRSVRVCSWKLFV